MKFTSIHSSDLPEINVYVKECINAGQWFLFKSASGCPSSDVFFFLKIEENIYALGENGQILETFPLKAVPRMDEFIYFEDLPKPISLSNQFA